jgi:fumarate reductase subunit C
VFVLSSVNKITIICLLIGGILTLIPILPVFEEIFPIISDPDLGIMPDRGATLLKGVFTPSGDADVDSWSLIPLPGILWFIILLILSVMLIVVGMNGLKEFLPIKDDDVPLGLSSLVGIIAGIIILLFFLLVFLADPDMSGMAVKNQGLDGKTDTLGLGLVLIVIGSIVSLIGGIFSTLQKE